MNSNDILRLLLSKTFRISNPRLTINGVPVQIRSDILWINIRQKIFMTKAYRRCKSALNTTSCISHISLGADRKLSLLLQPETYQSESSPDRLKNRLRVRRKSLARKSYLHKDLYTVHNAGIRYATEGVRASPEVILYCDAQMTWRHLTDVTSCHWIMFQRFQHYQTTWTTRWSLKDDGHMCILDIVHNSTGWRSRARIVLLPVWYSSRECIFIFFRLKYTLGAQGIELANESGQCEEVSCTPRCVGASFPFSDCWLQKNCVGSAFVVQGTLIRWHSRRWQSCTPLSCVPFGRPFWTLKHPKALCSPHW